MKVELKAKLLYCLPKEHSDKEHSENQGFTLIELLVVIIIIGILTAIALPSFLNQANRARQAEAKQTVSSMNRAQQAYYAENIIFGTSFQNLGLGLQSQTTNYQYRVLSADDPTFTRTVNNRAMTSSTRLRSYVGAVTMRMDPITSQASNLTIMCETIKSGPITNLATDSPDILNQHILLGRCQDVSVSAYRIMK